MRSSLLAVLASVLLSVLAVTLVLPRGKAPSSAPSAQEQEPAFERVMRTGTIRCGYALWPPYAVFKDANTGELKGIFPDIINLMGEKMHLKIVWAEETGWGSFIEGLKTQRYDLMCAPLWRVAEQASQIQYTIPLNYSAEHFYARKDDMRFDASLNGVNDPSVKLAALDGEWSQFIAREFFPKARRIEHQQMDDISLLLMDVIAKKADGVFLPADLGKDFAAKNPGTIRQVTQEPYEIFPNSFGARMGEARLIHMVDTALTEMMNNGSIDRIVAKYEPDRSIFLPVAKPYVYIKPEPLK